MVVLKFGGSSVASASSIRQVLSILTKQDKPMVVVVSALGGVTDDLHRLGTLAAKGDKLARTKRALSQMGVRACPFLPLLYSPARILAGRGGRPRRGTMALFGSI